MISGAAQGVTIRIAQEEMEAFAEASGDLNPLHLEGAPAAGRAFEAPVAYGALTVLKAIGELSGGSDRGLEAVEATFGRPLLVGVEYELELSREGQARATALIRDGDLPAVRVKARFAEGEMRAPRVTPAERLGQPERHGLDDLWPGKIIEGSYGAGDAALGRIRRQLRLGHAAIGDYALHSLFCASYLVGMVAPGLGGMMSSLRFKLSPPAGHDEAPNGDDGPLSYRVSVVEVEPGLGTVTLASEIGHAGREVARVTCEAHLPRDRPALDLEVLESELGGVSKALMGRSAVVIGASGGLGAALAHGLASQGCAVYACSRSGVEREPPPPPAWAGSIHHVRGDGSDAGFCQQLRERVAERHGGLDFLLCCAAPPLGGIGFSALSAGRFNAFVQRSVELVSVPMAAMLRAVDERAGTCVVVSSEAVTTMPGEWGHYVVAKGAGEALAAWSARRFPRVEMLVARVPQLGGRSLELGGAAGAVGKEAAAARLVRRLISPSTAGVQLIEWPA